MSKNIDPACGSGNFLTEAYLELRALENEILAKLIGDQMAIEFQEEGLPSFVKVNVGQFYGIEINDFAVSVANTALWIADHQSNIQTAKILGRPVVNLPLKKYENIVQANALRIDWNDILPASECDYVMGNPPFIGYSNLNHEQKEDRASVFGKKGGLLDYAACWYKKASEYTKGTDIRCAFVTTNSICQGQQVEPLWEPLFKEGISIDFAWRSFVWDSEASDMAHVHVVIVGFSYIGVKQKKIFDKGEAHQVSHINAYLIEAPDVCISRRTKPLSSVPEMAQGFKPADGGNLILSREEKNELIRAEPGAEKWIRKFSMGAEFIRGIDRYCLWLPDITAEELKELPLVRGHIDRCREWREEQVKTGDAYKLKDTPHLFRPCGKYKEQTYIGVPKVSSERRNYIPMGLVDNGMIPGDMLYFVPSESLYLFGVLTSQFHNAWMRVVAGRLEMRYRYANTVVYNNFIIPPPANGQENSIERYAQGVLDARRNYPEASLADMYDPDNDFLYPDLIAAHKALDKAVEQAYGVNFNGDEEKIVAHLFKLYAEATGGENA